jgi:hypothetical protein
LGDNPKRKKLRRLSVRGYQKKVIYLKDTGSHLFDEAYFVVSRKGEEAHIEQTDMIYEANRIIRESLMDKEARIKGSRAGRKSGFFLPFFLGAFITFLLALGVYLIF